MNYDANDLQSVLEYMRDEFGKRIFRDAPRMYATLQDLAPGLKSEGAILRQLAESGLLSELEQEADTGDERTQSRALVKVRYKLEKELFVNQTKTDEFLTALAALYGLKLTLTPPQPQQKPPQQNPPQPQPSPPPKKSNLPLIYAAFALIIVTLIGVAVWKLNPLTLMLPQNSSANGVSVELEQKQSQSQEPEYEQEQVLQAKESPKPDYVEWTLENGVLTVSGHGSMENYGDSDNSPPWANYREEIKTIIIMEGITRIGNRAFRWCMNLTKVVIADSVTRIGNHAFFDCFQLMEITIPNRVTEIGEGAFYQCPKITEITIPDSVTGIGSYAFAYCSGLKKITIPCSVRYIGQSAFDSCINLTEITLPNGVTYIGDNAFHNCSNLKEITIPDSVTHFGIGAFADCVSLKTASIPVSWGLLFMESKFPYGTEIIQRK